MKESYFDVIENNSHKEWLTARKNGIGGSDASAILGLNPYKTNVELFEEKTGVKVSKDISQKSYVQYGIQAEPLIRQLFQLDFPEYQVSHHENRILQNKRYPFLLASLDGVLVDEKGHFGVLEIKTSMIAQASQYNKWNHRIPDNYYIQILHYMLVTGYDFAVLCAHLRNNWDGEKRTSVRHYVIKREEVKDDLELLLEKEIAFWQCVKSGKKPALILPEI